MPELPSGRRIYQRCPPLPTVRHRFPDEPPLSRGLAEMAGYALQVRCLICTASAELPLRRLAADHGWSTPLGKILPRLCCGRCRLPPASITLIDTLERSLNNEHDAAPRLHALRLK